MLDGRGKRHMPPLSCSEPTGRAAARTIVGCLCGSQNSSVTRVIEVIFGMR
jgi:hypothetical protein